MPGNPTVELWTLYALGVSFTILRTYARVLAVGFRRLSADDYLIWLAIVSTFLDFAIAINHERVLMVPSRSLSTRHNAVSDIV